MRYTRPFLCTCILMIITMANADMTIKQIVLQQAAERSNVAQVTDGPTPSLTSTEAPAPTTPPPACRSTYNYTSRGKQYKYYSYEATWEQARNACRNDEAILFQVLNYNDVIAIAEFRVEMGANDLGLWMGLRQTGDLTFAWEDGIHTIKMNETLTLAEDDVFQMFEYRHTYDPDYDPTHGCMRQDYANDRYQWDRYNCYSYVVPFICECLQ